MKSGMVFNESMPDASALVNAICVRFYKNRNVIE